MDESVSQFLQFLAVEKGASNNTIAAYRNDIQQFSGFCDGRKNGRGWADINRQAIQDYMQDLQDKRYAEATVARKVAAVKSFFGFLTAEGRIPQDPTESLSSPRVGKTLPKPITPQQLDALIHAARTRRSRTPFVGRDRSMFYLVLAYSGYRKSEVLGMTRASFDLAGDSPAVLCVGG